MNSRVGFVRKPVCGLLVIAGTIGCAVLAYLVYPGAPGSSRFVRFERRIYSAGKSGKLTSAGKQPSDLSGLA
jgi:hypothetical protein